MYWDNAFFARTKIEPLMWDEDPGDHALMAEVPKLLFSRAAILVQAFSFATKRAKPSPEPVRMYVVRNGVRRLSVPIDTPP